MSCSFLAGAWLTPDHESGFLAAMSVESRQDVALAFLSILFEGAPFILLGTLISGLLDVYLPPAAMDRCLPKNRSLAVVVAGLLGAVFPVCECAVVPVIRRLVRKGLPVSCALTYMLAAPIVNPITALSTWKAFQGQAPMMMTASRLLLGWVIAVGVGLAVARVRQHRVLKSGLLEEMQTADVGEHHHGGCAHHHECGHTAPTAHSHADVSADSRLVAAFRSALKDFVDVAVYFSVGVGITALFNTGIAPGATWLDGLAGDPVGAPAALMGLAFVLSLCSTSDAFIAATLDRFSWAAKLAFLTFGPMMDVKLLFLYQSVLRRRFILLLALALFFTIGVVSVLWHHLVPVLP